MHNHVLLSSVSPEIQLFKPDLIQALNLHFSSQKTLCLSLEWSFIALVQPSNNVCFYHEGKERSPCAVHDGEVTLHVNQYLDSKVKLDGGEQNPIHCTAKKLQRK